ncbi:hypothetical protein [Nocardioides sp.]|uniref:hypothetical protein n=1 Tax=Nocardioides sp. TaxID=35761 RepID=UPI003D101219
MTTGRLPDFFLIGAPKAGTTALHAALAQHPHLQLSKVKEPKYYGARARAIGPVIRAGAAVGQFLPPEVWRTVSKPLIAQLHENGDPARPRLTPAQRDALLQPHLPDIELLEKVTGESFVDWKTYRDGGSFESRRASVTQG